jgi:hypothetical protein
MFSKINCKLRMRDNNTNRPCFRPCPYNWYETNKHHWRKWMNELIEWIDWLIDWLIEKWIFSELFLEMYRSQKDYTAVFIFHAVLITCIQFECLIIIIHYNVHFDYTSYPSGAPEFTPVFSGVRVTRSLV